MEIVLPVEACSCIYVMIKRKALDVSVAAKSAIAHAVGLINEHDAYLVLS